MSETEYTVLLDKVYECSRVAAEIRHMLGEQRSTAPAFDASSAEQQRYGELHAQLTAAAKQLRAVYDSVNI